MSFIYEALKRAEDENAKGVAVPRVVRRPPFFVTRPRWWVWALIAVLGVNAVVVTLVFVRSSRPPEVAMSPAPVAAPPPRTPEVVNEAPPAPAVVAPAPPTLAPPVATPAAKPAPRAARPAAPSVTPAPRPAPKAAAVVTPPVVAAPPAAPAAPPAAPAAPPAAPTPPPAVATTPPTPAPAAPPPPGPAAPPAVEAPKIQIQVVLYSEVPAERLVFIDGRRYAEGDKVDPDTVVERITPQGAVIVRRGQSFTLNSGR